MYIKNRSIQLTYLLADMALTGILILIYNFKIQRNLLTTAPEYMIFVIFLALITLVNRYIDVLERGYLQEMKRVIIYAIRITLVIVAGAALGKKIIVTRFGLALFFIVLTLSLYGIHYLLKLYVLARMVDAKEVMNVVIFCESYKIKTLVKRLSKYKHIVAIIAPDAEGLSEFAGIQIVNEFSNFDQFIRQQPIDEIFVEFQDRLQLSKFFAWVQQVGVVSHINVSDIIQQAGLSQCMLTYQNGQTYLTFALNINNLGQVFLKRFSDICLSLIGLVFTGFIALIIWPIVKIQAPGPLIFKQKRVGFNGKFFYIYKFRSMYVNAEAEKAKLLQNNMLASDLVFKMKDDPRVFPLGQFLRSWSLDEFPQFLNVLKGEMSIVGTRPPTLDEWQKYQSYHFKRLFTKPGITGLWQVSGRNKIVSFDRIVQLDMQYIEKFNLLLDLKIILKTIIVILKREGSN